MAFLEVVAGVALLYLGGEWLVRGASGLGRRFGLSATVMGLTIVSFGTSSPELAATLAGVLEGAPAVAYGNVVGSNIANLGLVLGLTLLVRPFEAAGRFVRREIPVMLAASALLFLPVYDGRIGRAEGLLLLALLAAYLLFLFGREARDRSTQKVFAAPGSAPPATAARSLVAVVAGIGALVLGAHLLIDGAVAVARWAGVSDRVIGLTMVAFGTSLPELAASLVAAVRGESDLVLGNLVGSNIFNILFILGVTTVVRPMPVEFAASLPDLLAMMAISAAVWLFVLLGRRMARWQGLALAVAYATYVAFLFG